MDGRNLSTNPPAPPPAIQQTSQEGQRPSLMDPINQSTNSSNLPSPTPQARQPTEEVHHPPNSGDGELPRYSKISEEVSHPNIPRSEHEPMSEQAEGVSFHTLIFNAHDIEAHGGIDATHGEGDEPIQGVVDYFVNDENIYGDLPSPNPNCYGKGVQTNEEKPKDGDGVDQATEPANVQYELSETSRLPNQPPPKDPTAANEEFEPSDHAK